MTVSSTKKPGPDERSRSYLLAGRPVEAPSLPEGLYLVATPIGNLRDVTLRALEVLAAADVIACEDSRVTRKLLDHYGIRTPLTPYHEHNAAEARPRLLARIEAGEAIALVSDAGTPLVSDPGYKLVREAREAGIAVVPIPGASALLAALTAAGLPTDRFYFEGFLPARSAARTARLQELAPRGETLVFYESTNRLGDTLTDAIAVFGPERPAAVGRELTKLHETVYRGSLAEVRAAVLADPGGDRGECTWLLAGSGAEKTTDEAELARVVGILAAELPASQAASLAARLTGASRKAAYRLASGQAPAED